MALMHYTTISQVSGRSDAYPVALQDAVYLLVAEQKNFIPVYMPGMAVNLLEAEVEIAEQKGPFEGAMAKHQASETIHEFSGSPHNLVYGMKTYGLSGLVDGIILSDDFLSEHPAVQNADEAGFAFRITPKTFDLGFTGRFLEDKKGNHYYERLKLACDIYDAYDLATTICPQTIVAVNARGESAVVHENYQDLGLLEPFPQNPREQIVYVLHEERKENWRHWIHPVEVLPTDGKNIVQTEHVQRLNNYTSQNILFGHCFKHLQEFLELVTAQDDHLLWKICKMERGPNTPLIDLERHYGLRNHAAEFPFHKHRLQLLPGNAYLHFDQLSLHWDNQSALEALFHLDNMITDIWMDPHDHQRPDGWDIVYDQQRGITPQQPIKVDTLQQFRDHAVLL